MTTTLTDFSGETDNSKCISETGRCAGQRRGRAWGRWALNQVLAGKAEGGRGETGQRCEPTSEAVPGGGRGAQTGRGFDYLRKVRHQQHFSTGRQN